MKVDKNKKIEDINLHIKNLERDAEGIEEYYKRIDNPQLGEPTQLHQHFLTHCKDVYNQEVNPLKEEIKELSKDDPAYRDCLGIVEAIGRQYSKGTMPSTTKPFQPEKAIILEKIRYLQQRLKKSKE